MTTTKPPQQYDPSSRWDGGIADYPKAALVNQYAWGQSINFRSDPQKLTLLKKTTKESGSVVLGLPTDGDQVGTDTYYYDNSGSIYKRTSAGSHSFLKTVANSHGNGMKYYGEDDYLYYTGDRVIGRYGQILNSQGSPTLVDDFLGSEGGIPLNTNSLHLAAASSQYASRADTASLSITGNLTIEASISPDSLPTVGNSMVLFSKWDVNSNLRSYKFEIYAVSGIFGDGSSSSKIISVDTTDNPYDSACTGTNNSSVLSATNVNFAGGQKILIHQSQYGSTTGVYMLNKIISYTTGVIVLEKQLNSDYVAGAQVIVVNQYTDVTVNTGKTWSAKAWNGTTGGILVFLANGAVTVSGNISSTDCGYRGGASVSGPERSGRIAGAGESEAGNYNFAFNGVRGDSTLEPNGSGGGNPVDGVGEGADGIPYQVSTDLSTRFVFGGGASGVSLNGAPSPTDRGGNGGGLIYAIAVTLVVTGMVSSKGGTGIGLSTSGGGGGAILMAVQTATLGIDLLTCLGGAPTTAGPSGSDSSGAGSGATYSGNIVGGAVGSSGTNGTIHLNYLTSYTGSTSSPSFTASQDNTLVTTTTYQLRLGLSSNGTAEEYLTKAFTPNTGAYTEVCVAWTAASHIAEFMQNGVSLGTSNGSTTSLHDNASTPAIGCDFNSTPRNFYDGYIDEIRIWNIVRTPAQTLADKGHQISGATIGLAAYYQLNGNYIDSQTSANNTLTAHNTPTFSANVPFSDPTTRQDLDQSLTGSGQTYTLLTAISEGAQDRQTFVPTFDPQKSIEVNIDTVGTGDVTIIVHDPLNRLVATVTVSNASLHTGLYEFTFSDVWTPVRGATYHFHVIVSTGTSKIVTTTDADCETAIFNTYYQFLVTDTAYHPMEQILNLLAIGNGRYLAVYDAAGTYLPHRLVFPSGWKVRSLALWNGFLAIGCWKYDDITKSDKGMIFFWNGTSDTYDDYREVAEGGINAMIASRGRLYVWAGYHGDMLSYTGGQTLELEKRVPKILDEEYIEILPKAVTSWDGMLRFGFSGKSNSSNVERGVYTYAKRKSSNPMALSFDFPISTGLRSSTVKIGWVFPVGRKLLIGWEDNTSHGVDVVDLAGNYFSSGTIEQPIKDYGKIYKEKKGLTARVDFDPLSTGDSIQVKYKLDKQSNWVTSGFFTNASEVNSLFDGGMVRLPINKGNAKELEIAADITSATGATTPGVIGLSLEYDPLVNEGNF